MFLRDSGTEKGAANKAGGGWTDNTRKNSKSTSSSSSVTSPPPTPSFSLEDDKRRQDELDKLLAGLDQLTETLPDLKDLKEERLQICSGDKNVKPSDVINSAKKLHQLGTNILNEKMTTSVSQQPYHSRQDSKPFSYIRTNGSNQPSRNVSRASSKEALNFNQGLESPNLLRKIMGTSNGNGSARSSPLPPKISSNEVSFTHQITQQRQQNYGDTSTSSVNLSSNVIPLYSTVNKNHKTTTTIQINGDEPKSKLIKDLEGKSDEEASLSWLQKQQMKLQERREIQRRKDSRERDGDMMKELKTSLDVARGVMPSETHKPTFDVLATISPKQSFVPSPVNQVNSTTYRQKITEITTTSFNSPSIVSSTMLMSPNKNLLQRQKSDTSFDRSRPPQFGPARKLRYDLESDVISNKSFGDTYDHYPLPTTTTTYFRNTPVGLSPTTDFHFNGGSLPGSRPVTPGFPSNGGQARINHGRASPSVYNSSRRGSVSSTGTSELPTEVAAQHVKRAKDSHKYWYKPTISREDAINILLHQPSGTFIVRDSNSFPGAFGLALKVQSHPQAAKDDELVRHFLIEPTKKGVKLKGYTNEPVFASLSALVYQHTITPLALPTCLVLPRSDLGGSYSRDTLDSQASSQLQQLLNLGAACNVLYLFTMDTDSLTGPSALQKTISHFLVIVSKNAAPTSEMATCVHFKVSNQGITLTDNARRLFFRKHYNTHTISFCGVDPDDRSWSGDAKIFGFVARNLASKSGQNQCHVFAEKDPDQPAKAIVNFVNKVLLSNGSRSRSLSVGSRGIGNVV